MQPVVSVVVPVHNSAEHLSSTLQAIGAQSLDSIEIVLVDDGSTDASPSIMENFARDDSRVRIIPGPCTGSAGDARNAGLAVARGLYVSFLDSDDLFLPKMLETLVERAEVDRADVVACRFQTLNSLTGETERADWMLRVDDLPRSLPFAPEDAGDRLFFAFNASAWNKLFRRDFLVTAGLRFQSLRRTNDAYFTYIALALACRISYVDEVLVSYRIEQSSGLQATVDEDPLEFAEALDAIRERLLDEGLLPVYQRAFDNLVVSMSSSSLRRQRTPSSFMQLYAGLPSMLMRRFSMAGLSGDYFLRADLAAAYGRFTTESAAEFLFHENRRVAGEARTSQREARETLRLASLGGGAHAGSSGAEDLPPRPSLHLPAQFDVSVIIPVYNSLAFVREAVTSALGQSGVRMQVICVDDGSNDGSGELLDHVASGDERVTVVHQTNAGLSAARNAGLALATGRYVCFLDSDDLWLDDQLAELLGRAEAESLDLLLFDGESIREEGVEDSAWRRYATYYQRSSVYRSVTTGAGMAASMNQNSDYRASACLYLIRRDLLGDGGLQFVRGLIHEDNLFTLEALLSATRVGHSSVPFYGRRVRPESIMTASSRFASARSYFYVWVAMLRLLRYRDFGDATVNHELGAIAHSMFRAARNNAVSLSEEMIDSIGELDPAADAQSLFVLFRRTWGQDRARKKLERRLRTAEAAGQAAAPVIPARRSVPARLATKFRRLAAKLRS
ncbi:glycosyltransferase [Tessaracoccus lacteus]|uniref:Glycosyltransferase n=1 Tax=Tessaracoccus lacteus TaxID=3041766 RepID=A0ABY8PX36_9ACTN|nr:glycosyltransferase [Tessaracoccus sp. T21]WGT47039.1 glycosyltransferase [Tessaracoccus sp. T21]